jgi:hypothetical protein
MKVTLNQSKQSVWSSPIYTDRIYKVSVYDHKDILLSPIDKQCGNVIITSKMFRDWFKEKSLIILIEK